ncbi:MAG: enoyl-CoA hydratase [Deltaproteobacteria bacterium]|nr:enoyl-CoA hydratase [Deltaproteobacteria bacterium]MBI3387849.1 enoyl-CoA hydratase [Deltaproteobacteria bacterium]
MAYEHITLTTTDDGIVTLTFNRPETRNSMTPAMGEEVVAAVEQIRADAAARVFVLTGAGKSFSSGGDLGMLARDSGAVKDEAGPSMAGSPRDFYTRYLAIRRLAIPTIAAINGHAIGAGLCIALACDLRVAASDAKMGMTFTKLGIHPGMGATYFLPRLIGTARAAELFFTGRIIDAAEAERLGLLTRVVPREQFDDAVLALAREIASCGPIAVRMTKRAIYRGTEHTLDDMLDFESLQQGITFTTADAREGVLAIMEKRTPKFAGK